MTEREPARDPEDKGQSYKIQFPRSEKTVPPPPEARPYTIKVLDGVTGEEYINEESVMGLYAIVEIPEPEQKRSRFVTLVTPDDKATARVLIEHLNSFEEWLAASPSLRTAIKDSILTSSVLERIRKIIF